MKAESCEAAAHPSSVTVWPYIDRRQNELLSLNVTCHANEALLQSSALISLAAFFLPFLRSLCFHLVVCARRRTEVNRKAALCFNEAPLPFCGL